MWMFSEVKGRKNGRRIGFHSEHRKGNYRTKARAEIPQRKTKPKSNVERLMLQFFFSNCISLIIRLDDKAHRVMPSDEKPCRIRV